MNEKIVVDTKEEKVTVKWDGERFAIVQKKRIDSFLGLDYQYSVIIFNPREMLELITFVEEQC